MCVMSFNIRTYDTIYTDGATFAFLKNRSYAKVDSLLPEDSKQKLDHYISEKRYNETFLLVLSDADANPVGMLCYIKPYEFDSEDYIVLTMMKYDALIEDYSNHLEQFETNSLILKQFNDIFYSYDTASQVIECWRDDEKRELVHRSTLREFEEVSTFGFNEETREKISGFVFNIRTGNRFFADVAEDINEKIIIHMSGMALYAGGKQIKTVGKFSRTAPPVSSQDLYDKLTGAYLKGPITDYARHRINDLHERTAIAIVDLDYFKNVNDTFGHSKGDEVLRKVTDVLITSCSKIGKVGRIGGDEFFIVFDNFGDIVNLQYALRGISSLVETSFSEERDGFMSSVSVGCSVYPDDYNGSFEEMFKLADTFLYRAKEKGRARYIVYNFQKHGPIEELLRNGFKKLGFNKSELVCRLANSSILGERLDMEAVLNDILHYFAIERIILYNKTDRMVSSQCGQKHLSLEKIRKTIAYLYEDDYIALSNNGITILDDVEYLMGRAPEAYRMLKEQNAISISQYNIDAKSGRQFVLSLESVNFRNTWNKDDVHYYRIIAKVLEDIL